MKKGNIILGSILVLFGGVALLNNIGFIHYELAIWRFWPLVLLIPGLVFQNQYFSNHGDPGFLVPGGILTTYGLLFMYCSFFGYHVLAYLWPLFLGGVGVGLFQLYYFGNREKPLFYVSAGFLAFTAFTLFFGILNIKGNFVFPIILILIGASMLLKSNKDSGQPIITVEYENDEVDDHESR